MTGSGEKGDAKAGSAGSAASVESPPRRVLVTGAHGFIGGWLVERLRARGDKVRALVRRPDSIEGVELVVGDIADPDVAREAVRGVQAVVHTVAYGGSEFEEALRVNATGTRVLAEAALDAGCERFVHLSTCGVYALAGLDRVTEDTPMWPLDPESHLAYGVTKAQAERELARIAERGLPTVVLRPPNVLGPDTRNVFGYRIALVLRDGNLKVGGAGDNTWPYVHVENLLDAIELALGSEAAGGTYTVVDGHTTWGAFVGIFADWLGVTPGTRDMKAPYDFFRGRFSTDKIQRELGYRPRRTFDDAMAATKAFLLDRGVIPHDAAPQVDKRA